MEITGGKIIRNDTNENAMGGTEIIATNIAERVPQELLADFQIIHSRVRELDETKIRVFVAHDLPEDPEVAFLADGGWKKFHKLIFVSQWQMQRYIEHFNIPWSHCLVLQNAIEPIEQHEKPTDVIRLGYWSTPHRGLNIVVPVFEKLCEEYDNIELEVYSSFGLYGWDERDEHFKDLFEKCKEHEKINYHGAKSNAEVREALKDMHILSYPSIWKETSCLVLMEAMSAGMLCVHPNYGALSETAANWTYMYQYHEDMSRHASIHHMMLKAAIENLNKEHEQSRLLSQKSYSDVFYGWGGRVESWTAFLGAMLNGNPDRSLPTTRDDDFVYKAG
jgi:UDP-glucose:(glucosyl)LPS alpha-1,2-glucosyltransferase